MIRPERVVIFGGGGHAKSVADALLKSELPVAGYFDDVPSRTIESLGIRRIGAIDDLKSHRYSAGVVAIGDNWTRSLVVERVKRQVAGFHFVTVLHPAAVIGRGARIGAGSVVLAGAIVGAGAQVNDHVVIGQGASLDHDSLMEGFSMLAPGAVTGGSVRCKSFSMIGIGAVVIHGRTVGEHAVVGAGSTVTEDVPDYRVAMGSPARVHASRRPDEAYL